MKRIYKRKIKKFVKKNSFLLLIIVLLPVMFIMVTGYSLMNSTHYINGNASITSNSGDEDIKEDKGETCNADITYSSNFWSTSPLQGSLNVTITNNSTSDFNYWKLKLNTLISSTASNDWQSQVIQDDAGYYYVIPSKYNNVIKSGESRTIAFSLFDNTDNSITEESLKNFILVSCGGVDKIISDGELSLGISEVEYKLDSEITLVSTQINGEPYNEYNVTITNNGTSETTSWRGVFYYGDTTIKQICAYQTNDDQENHILSIKNMSGSEIVEGCYVQGNIDVGESLTFKVILGTDDPNFMPKGLFVGIGEL